MSNALKKSYLISLMIFIMSWASFANAYILQIHQQVQFESLIQTDAYSVDYSHDLAVEELTSGQLNCHDSIQSLPNQHMKHPAQDDSTQQDSTKHFAQTKHTTQSCQDCHVFHCQLASSGLIPEMIGLSSPNKTEYLQKILTSYDGQHLAGHTAKILRPPKI